MHLTRDTGFDPERDRDGWSILICLLGTFRVLKRGEAVPLRGGGKLESLLSYLALRQHGATARDTLLDSLWASSEPGLAGQSLNSLVYSSHKLLADAIGGAAPVLHNQGHYRLNVEAGISVDVACFDAEANAGDQQARTGGQSQAAACYRRAVELYRGDLCTTADVYAIIERERLRARFLTLLARLADYHYRAGEYDACLALALQLLAHDPCREDAHRVVMRCHVRLGARAQALRQYRVCADVLRSEFDVEPEPVTTALFDQVRRDPASI